MDMGRLNAPSNLCVSSRQPNAGNASDRQLKRCNPKAVQKRRHELLNHMQNGILGRCREYISGLLDRLRDHGLISRSISGHA